MSRTGRPKHEFDLAQVEAFGACGASQSYMARFFGVSPRTIGRQMKTNADKEGTFAYAYAKGEERQKFEILQHTYERALKSDKVLMFLLERKLGWVKPAEEGSQEVTIRHIDAEGKPVDGLPIHLIPFADRKNVPPKTLDANGSGTGS